MFLCLDPQVNGLFRVFQRVLDTGLSIVFLSRPCLLQDDFVQEPVWPTIFESPRPNEYFPCQRRLVTTSPFYSIRAIGVQRVHKLENCPSTRQCQRLLLFTGQTLALGYFFSGSIGNESPSLHPR